MHSDEYIDNFQIETRQPTATTRSEELYTHANAVTVSKSGLYGLCSHAPLG